MLNKFLSAGRNRTFRPNKILYAIALMVGLPAEVIARSSVNLPVGVTEVSEKIFDLHMMILWICVIIGVIVFTVMTYSIINHRKSKGYTAAKFHESTTIEIFWTLIPLIVLVGIAIPATKTLIEIEDTEEADMTIKITGYQWKWQYEYLDDKISFFSNLATSHRDAIRDDAKREKLENYLLEVDKPVVVPINTRIRFLMTSNDVIHSWWVQDLGVKQDANPGFINSSWANIRKVGIYRGQCTELCGKDHGFMPIVIDARSPEDYKKWVALQHAEKAAAQAAAQETWSKEKLMAQGKTVYATSCAACHGASGAGISGIFPAITGSPISKGDVKAHIDIVMNGKAGTAMQAFKSQLSDTDLAAVITFERNGLGNNMGDLVQPNTIKSSR